MISKEALSEQRRYTRLNTILPVEFRILSQDQQSLSDWLAGFSNNISRSGICVFSNLIPPELWKSLKDKETIFQLRIHIPFSWKTISTRGKLVWHRRGKVREANFSLGLEFLDLSEKERKNLIFFTYWRNFIPKVSLSTIIVLTFSLLYLYYQNQKILNYNRKIAKELVETSLELNLKKEVLEQNQAVVKMFRGKLNRVNRDLEKTKEELALWEKEYEHLKKERKNLLKEFLSSEEALEKEREIQEKIAHLQRKLSLLIQENKSLQDKLKEAKALTASSQRELRRIQERKQLLEKFTVKDMYKWIRNHQNLKTGLVVSFEGGFTLSGWAFTYDQALCVNVFLLFSDFERAKNILDFYKYKAKTYQGGFLNAYYVDDGSPCEYIVHAGPNIWLGLGILRYTEATSDKSYLNLAERIAKFVLSLQDSEGGIIGGPKVSWYSTEHNLDAYAFFKGLYKLTEKSEYLLAQERVKTWLKKYSYTKKDIPINRGKGDSTIATDTYAWSIASLGAEELISLEMDPDEILEFAIENCRVKNYLEREDKKILVEGFDFARIRHLPRGGVISCEWTAQMVLAFQIMANYYQKKSQLPKANYYQGLARHYLSELEKMIISSPSPTGQGKGCLPYASSSSADTGHGWRTPQGKRVCSLASTSYYIFAYYGYNPLAPDLGFKKLSSSE